MLQRESSLEENGSRDCETAKARRRRLFKINNLQTKINLTDKVPVNIYKQELDIQIKLKKGQPLRFKNNTRRFGATAQVLRDDPKWKNVFLLLPAYLNKTMY